MGFSLQRVIEVLLRRHHGELRFNGIHLHSHLFQHPGMFFRMGGLGRGSGLKKLRYLVKLLFLGLFRVGGIFGARRGLAGDGAF